MLVRIASVCEFVCYGSRFVANLSASQPIQIQTYLRKFCFAK